MLPGGLGVAEGSLTGLLVGFGTPLPEAAAATLLVRGATLAGSPSPSASSFCSSPSAM